MPFDVQDKSWFQDVNKLLMAELDQKIADNLAAQNLVLDTAAIATPFGPGCDKDGKPLLVK